MTVATGDSVSFPGGHDDAARWERVLDDYERRLGEQRLAIAQVAHGTTDLGGRGVPPTFIPPASLGAVPASLVPRARALAEATRVLAAEAAGVLAELPTPPVTPRTAANGGMPSRFDRTL